MPRTKKQVKSSAPITEKAVIVTNDQDSGAPFFLFLSMFLKATALALLLVLVPLLVIGAVFVYSYSSTLASHSGMPISSLISTVRQGWSRQVEQSEGRKNILILGVDSLATRENESINTDTIMVASLNLEQGKIVTFSIPRDLFLTSEKSKINGVFANAVKRGESNPELATKQVVEKLVGVPLHHVIVLEIEEVGRIIDSLGGLDVSVERSFTDEKYPNEEADPKTEKNPERLYKTVSFSAGVERMDGKRALQFIRSRHSIDPIEGSDDARARRQQKVIEALTGKLSDAGVVKNPSYLGDLIRLYNEKFEKYLSMEEVVAVVKVFLSQRRFPSIAGQHFSIQGFDPDPVIYHPERFYTGQWVYLPIDASGKKLMATVSGWLK